MRRRAAWEELSAPSTSNSTDLPSNDLFPSHRVCRDRGIFHWEWLVNLEELIGKGEFMFYGVPLLIKGGSGSPVRAFAVLDE